MYNPSNVHAFFEKLSSAARNNVEKKPSLEMLHSSIPTRNGYIEGSLQEAMMSAAAQNPPCLVSTALNDFGVGLPPLSAS
ncbi:MAG: hypothetical protein U0103_00455 [Candidatus Obscuribacterales bacterium]|nr:hypothetical protein [Cyanobacteria bacterium SZAS LIN-5]RTL42646.1 MAG: hypothetical protein EKK48_11710 [Candidatus Melainabacteria bacterium]